MVYGEGVGLGDEWAGLRHVGVVWGWVGVGKGAGLGGKGAGLDAVYPLPPLVSLLTPSYPPGLSGGAVAGIVLGVLLGLGLIAAGGVVVWRHLKR